MTSDDDLIAEVEAVLASVEIVDEDSFRAAVEKLHPGLSVPGELVYVPIDE